MWRLVPTSTVWALCVKVDYFGSPRDPFASQTHSRTVQSCARYAFDFGNSVGTLRNPRAYRYWWHGRSLQARDTRLDRAVAIKVLLSNLSSNPELRARFDREAKAISSLSHPNICTLYDVGHQEGHDFLVMEFLEGETLADRLKSGPLPIDEVLKISVEIADALDKVPAIRKHGRCRFSAPGGNGQVPVA